VTVPSGHGRRPLLLPARKEYQDKCSGRIILSATLAPSAQRRGIKGEQAAGVKASYSITSSAMASSVSGTSMLSTLAVAAVSSLHLETFPDAGKNVCDNPRRAAVPTPNHWRPR
jgi:hypothetical protein